MPFIINKTYYKYNSEKQTVEVAQMETDMEAYKDYEDDIIIKVDFDIDRTISRIPNWTVKATNVSGMSIDLTKYQDHKLVEYYLEFVDDAEKYPTNDTVHLRSEIEINNDLVVSSQKHIDIPKPYISGEDVFVYDGYRKTPNIIWDSRLTLTTPDSVYGTDPGAYTVTFKLPNDDSYMWDDGSEGPFSLQWHITSTAGENPNGIQAYAIYTASDRTLRFYKNADNPRENNQYLGKTVTKKFANVEEISATSPNGVPWRALYYDKIGAVGDMAWLGNLARKTPL